MSSKKELKGALAQTPAEKQIDELQKRLSDKEKELITIEEEASEQFSRWYKLHEERNALVKEAKALIRDTPFTGKTHNYGLWNITNVEQTVVDVSRLRREAPDCLALPGVVKSVDVDSLLSAIASGDVTVKDAETIKACITKEPGTPRISGPKETIL